MTIQQDREELSEIAAGVSLILTSITDHDIVDGAWPIDGPVDAEISRLRGRLIELEDMARTQRVALRELEVRRIVEGVWADAFAAGQVDDHEEEPGDRDALNPHGVAAAIVQAEEESRQALGIDPAPVESLAANLNIKFLDDAVFSRIIETEGSLDEPEDQALEDSRSDRATSVVRAFLDAVEEEAQQ